MKRWLFVKQMGLWLVPFVFCSAPIYGQTPISTEPFQELFSYDTTLFITPKKVISVSSLPSFYYSVNDQDLWVGQNVGHGARKMVLYEVHSDRQVILNLPRSIWRFTQKWPPAAVYVDSAYIVVDYFNLTLLYEWKTYGSQARLVEAKEMRYHNKSHYKNRRFTTVSDYELMGKNDNRHYVDYYEVKDDKIIDGETRSYLSDLPEYCVYGFNMRYLCLDNGFLYCDVAEPRLIYEHDNQTDTILLNGAKHWHYPNMKIMDSLRTQKMGSGYQAQFWLNHLRDVQRHHSTLNALEQMNDSLILIRWYQPNDTMLCLIPDHKGKAGRDKFELFNINSGQILPYMGNFYRTIGEATVLSRDKIDFRCLMSCKNGIWHEGDAYEITWGSPIIPLGMTYGEYRQAEDKWLSKNDPVIRINKFVFVGERE